jgi:hypothetical protein
MSEQTNTQPQKEIDLIEVTGKMFSGIGKGLQNLFSWLKRLIQYFFRLCLKYWWILLVATIFGGTFGYFKVKWTKDFFETEMLADTSVVSGIQIANRINSLQNLIQDDNNTVLANQLSLSPKEVDGIFFIRADFKRLDISGKPTKVVVRERDGITVEEFVPEISPQFLRIRVRTREKEKISRLGQAIVNFVENDAFIKERINLAKRVNLQQQEAIEFEIQQLMLFQRKNIERSPQVFTSGSSPLMVVNEEKTYTTEILDLRNELAVLQRNYELLRPLFVIQPFTPFENPVDRRMRNILFFATMFFGIGYCSLLFREGWKRI